MLKIKDNIDLKVLEKFGFVDGVYTRIKNGEWLYQIYVTQNHKYLQIKVYNHCLIAHRLQDLIYDLSKADLVEKVEEKSNEN